MAGAKRSVTQTEVLPQNRDTKFCREPGRAGTTGQPVVARPCRKAIPRLVASLYPYAKPSGGASATALDGPTIAVARGLAPRTVLRLDFQRLPSSGGHKAAVMPANSDCQARYPETARSPRASFSVSRPPTARAGVRVWPPAAHLGDASSPTSPCPSCGLLGVLVGAGRTRPRTGSAATCAESRRAARPR